MFVDMSRHMTERTTVRLPPELLRRARRKAIKEGRTLTSLIEDGLRRVLNERDQKAEAAHKPAPVSSAIGGLKPGFSWESLASQAEEMDDLDYVRRFF